MAIEFVEYIGDYKPYLPNAYDYAHEGDDHLRNIKKGLLGTFPEFDKAIDYSSEELNIMDQYLGGDDKKGLIWKQHDADEQDKILKVQPNGTIISEDELPPVGTIVPTFSFSGGEQSFEALYGKWFVKCDGATTVTDEAINIITGEEIFTAPKISDDRYVRMAPTEDKIKEEQTAVVNVTDWSIKPGKITGLTSLSGGAQHNHNQVGSYGPAQDNRYWTNVIHERNWRPWEGVSYLQGAGYAPSYYFTLSKDGGQMGGGGAHSQTAFEVTGNNAPSTWLMGLYQVGTLSGFPHAHVIKLDDTKIYANVVVAGGATETRPKSYTVVYYIRTK